MTQERTPAAVAMAGWEPLLGAPWTAGPLRCGPAAARVARRQERLVALMAEPWALQLRQARRLVHEPRSPALERCAAPAHSPRPGSPVKAWRRSFAGIAAPRRRRA